MAMAHHRPWKILVHRPGSVARANEAAADAELAQARATSGEAQKAAAEVEKSTETLQREAVRSESAPRAQSQIP